MLKFLVPLALILSLDSKAQSIVSLENTALHIISLSVIKSDTLKVDAISVSATYYGNETDNAAKLIPDWVKKYKSQQCTANIDITSFDMTKPFKIILTNKGQVVKVFEMSRRIAIKGQMFSNYECI